MTWFEGGADTFDRLTTWLSTGLGEYARVALPSMMAWHLIWLHLMTQSPSTLPPGIVDSYNNAFVVQLKAPKGRDLMMARLALSEKGFVDEHYKRYISRMEVARSIVKLGYLRDKRDVQPMLAEALIVPAREPTDTELLRRFLIQR